MFPFAAGLARRAGAVWLARLRFTLWGDKGTSGKPDGEQLNGRASAFFKFEQLHPVQLARRSRRPPPF